MKYFSKLLLVVFASVLSSNSYCIGYPDSNVDLGNEGDFLWKRGNQFGRTANLTNIGPYIVNLPEGPGSSGVALPGNTPVYHDSIWDVSDLTNPVMIHEFGQAGQPIHAHATVIRFSDTGPRLMARNSGDLGYNPDGATAIDQIDFGSASWGHDIFTYSQMTSPLVARNYWSYGLNREGVYAVSDPARPLRQPEQGGWVYTEGPLRDLYGYNLGVWEGEPHVYWDHFAVADVTGFSSFHGHYLVVASDQLSTGIAIYDASGIREGRPPRLVSVFQPQVTEPDGGSIGVGGYWVEPYGTTKMVFAARRNQSVGRSYPALYVIDFEDASNPFLSCEIYFNRDDNDPSDGDSSSDPMYVNFQDEYVYVDHFRVNLEACENAYTAGNSITGSLFDEIVYRFDDIANECDASQYFRPLGQVGLFGGYDWWVTPEVNEQGMCGFLTSDEPDTRAPFVSGHRPFSGQAGYPIDGFIHIHIPETLRTETLDGAVTVTNLDSGQTVEFRQIFTHTGTISIFPSSYFDESSRYRVDITGVQDFMGNLMDDYSFEFTTGNSDLLQGDSPFPPLDYNSPAPPAQIFEADDSGTVTVPADDSGTVPTYTGPSYIANQSSPIACTPETEVGDIWSVNPDNDSIAILESDLDASSMVKTHQLRGELYLNYEAPTSVTRLAEFYAVTYRDDDKIVFFSSSGQPAFSIDSGHGTQPVASVSDEQFLYVALYASGEIIKIDVSERTIVQRLSVGQTPKAMALHGDRLLVTRFISPIDHGEVYDIDVTDSMTLDGIIVLNKILVGDDIDHGNGVPNYLSSIVIDQAGERAYVTATKANTDRGLSEGSANSQPLDADNTVRPMVAIIDLVNSQDFNTDPMTRSGTIDLDNGADPSAVTFLINPSVRVTSLRGNDILIFNDSDRNSTAQFDTQGGPIGMCSTRRTLYVKNFTGRSVTAIDVSAYLDNGSLQQVTENISTVGNEVLTAEELDGLRTFYHSEIPSMGPEGYITCASCHAGGSHDGRVWNITQLGEGHRNTISLNGASGTRFGALHWSSNFDEVQDFELQMESLNEGEGLVPGQTFSDESPLEFITTGLSGELDNLAAYVSSLGKDSVKRSPYRTYDGQLTEAALRGQVLFASSGCADCHSGAAFRDGLRHDVGTISQLSGQRLGGQLDAIRTPTLIELWDSAPYFHDGSAATLSEVFTVGDHITDLSTENMEDMLEFLLSIDRELYIDDE